MQRNDAPWMLVLLAGMGAMVAPGLYRRSGSGEGLALSHEKVAHAAAKATPSGHHPSNAPQGDEPTAIKARDLLRDVVGWPARPKDTLEGTVAELRTAGVSISSLIVTVPDPALTAFDSSYDQALESVERAAAAADFAPYRFDLPWSEPVPNATAFDIALPSSIDPAVHVRPPTEDAAETTAGVLIFRRWKPTDHGSRFPDLLVALIVGETATGGLHQVAFRAALSVADTIDTRQRFCAADGSGPPLSILGPFFSSSALSLRLLLDEHLASHGRAHGSIVVVTGTANGRNNFATLGAPGNIQFSSATVSSDALQAVILREIAERGSKDPGTQDVAFLVEAGTSWGLDAGSSEELDASPGRTSGPPLFHFPLHVAQLRAEREKSKGNAQADVRFPSLETTLQLHLDQDRESRDELPVRSSLTPYTVELALREQLGAIAREHYRFLGILATDPMDTVFIAEEARQYCPGVQLFAVGAEQLFSHPDLMHDLNGLLVASTYPLSEDIDGWTNDSNRQAFASEVAEGVYNAGVALLHEIGLTSTLKDLRDYRNPFDDSSAGAQVWLSMINNGASWPIHVEAARGDSFLVKGLPAAPGRSSQLRHSVGALAGGTYWLVVSAGLFQLFWLGFTVRGRRAFRHADLVLRLERARATGAMLAALFFTILYWTVVVARLSKSPTTVIERWAWPVAEIGGFAASAILFLAFVRAAVPALQWMISGLRAEPPAHRSARIRSAIVCLCGLVVGVLGVLFIANLVWPPAGSTAGDLFLTLFRTIEPTGGVSVALPLLYVAIAIYLWGYFDYRRAREQARFPDAVPFPQDAGLGFGHLRDTAAEVAFGSSKTFRTEEILALASAVVPGIYFCHRLTPTFETAAFDHLFKAAVFFLVAIILSSAGRVLAHWSDLERFLGRLDDQPFVDAFDRMGPAPPRLFGLDLGARLPHVEELEEVVRLTDVLANETSPTAAGGSFSERLQTEVVLIKRVFQAEIGGAFPDARVGAQAALFRMARLLFTALERVWAAMPLPGEVIPVSQETPSERGVETRLAFQAYRRHAPPDTQRWIRTAEDVVARQVVAVIDLGLTRLRNLMTFTVTASLLLVCAIVSYPFYPTRFVQLFAWAFAMASIVVSCIVLAAIERNRILSRIAHTDPGRLNFNPAFLGQIVIYGVLPFGALLATVFPEVGGVLSSWLQPLARALR